MRENLTNEELFGKFASPFNLVNHAILLAKRIVQRDQEEHANLASEVLEMIIDGEDTLEEMEAS